MIEQQRVSPLDQLRWTIYNSLRGCHIYNFISVAMHFSYLQNIFEAKNGHFKDKKNKTSTEQFQDCSKNPGFSYNGCKKLIIWKSFFYC